ncbi:hypothetical protein [Streptomyces sp. NPDC059003]|uniref:hypothetical protein n=1 Tax=Streptomyces sp. NPDC059003 TaxID=3346691 RepID=UPI0036A203C1
MTVLRGIALAGVVMLFALVMMISLTLQAVFSGSDSVANAQTCSAPLRPVGNGTEGTGPQGPDVKFEGKTKPSSTKRVTVPLRPQGPQQQPRWSRAQERNAAVITNVARTRNLSPRAAVIAVATAMQESTLRNLRGGHSDSAGLFQQRPSQNWGTLQQVSDPVHASNSFYDRLIRVANWQTSPLTRVAQQVQRSGHPTAYARWESSAGALVAKTWGAETVTSVTDGCAGDRDAPPGKFKAKNPRTPQQAIQAARKAPTIPLPLRTCNAAGTWAACCDNFVAQAYGYGSSGSVSANAHWDRLVSAGRAHAGSNTPPPGALLFYATDSQWGHVALYLGNDLVASNDIKRRGYIDIVRRKDLTHGTWRLRYRGWTEPSFPSAAGTPSI